MTGNVIQPYALPNLLAAGWIAVEQAKACSMFGLYDTANPLFDVEP